MLNGVAPILIFTFPPVLGIDFSKILGGIPLVKDVFSNIGIPLPIYLDERLTGIYIESESKSIDIDTDITPKYETNSAGGIGTTTLINQSGINNLVTINMLASTDNLLLSVLIALNDMVFSKLVSGKYSISYLNNSTLIFKGLLHSFQTSSSSGDTLLKITMQIQKNEGAVKTVLGQYLSLPGDQIAIPGRL